MSGGWLPGRCLRAQTGKRKQNRDSKDCRLRHNPDSLYIARRWGKSLVGDCQDLFGRKVGPPKALPLWEEIWPGPAMKLVGALAARWPGLRLQLVLALEIERHCSADEILQGRPIDLVAFVDVDGAPGIPGEAGVE
jgi:hypothetical protein